MTVKRAWTVVLVTASVAGLLAGCKTGGTNRSNTGGSVTRSAAAPEDYRPEPGVYGGRLVLATISDPKSFNPITSGETTTSDYTVHIFLGLTTTNPWTYEVEPELAVSWTPDETGKVWTVKLREGVEWSDGHPFTADDVLFSFDTVYNPDIVTSMREILSGPNGERWQLEKVDDHTVRFTLPEVNAIFPLLLADGMIIPRHRYEALVESGRFNEALGTDTPPDQIVGTGPFLLDRVDPGQQVILKRNPRYYRRDSAGQPLPYLDELVFRIVPSIDVQILQFQQGQTDIAGLRGMDFPILAPLQESGNFTIYRLGPAMGSEFITFNQNTGANPDSRRPFVAPHKLRWFRDTRFRQAVSHAINREFIVKSIMNGLGYPQYGPINHASGFFFANPDAPRYEYNLDKARALLAEMGLIDRNGDGVLEDEQGNRVEFNLTTNSGNDVRERIAETIRKDLETLGMRVNYRPMEFNVLISRMDATFDWEALVMGLTGGPEPHWGANVWRSSGRMHMWFPFQETPSTDWERRIDELFAQGVRQLDPEQRRQTYFEWQRIVGEEQPFIYTATPERLTALRNRFGNVFPAPLGGVLHNVDEIYVLPSK